jgi:hypothetical protein
MYTIRNKGLDNIKKDYSIEKLEELDADTLYTVATERKEFRVIPAQKIKNGNPAGLDRFATIDRIIDSLSVHVSAYLPVDYWEERHHEVNEESELLRMIKRHGLGEETFRLFARHNMGFYRLKPDEEIQLDVPKRWIQQLLQGPLGRVLELVGEEEVELPKPETGLGSVDLKEETEKPAEVTELPKKDVVSSDLNNLDVNNLRAIAKSREINTFGMKKLDIVRAILETNK